jgi:hypothetical protein
MTLVQSWCSGVMLRRNFGPTPIRSAERPVPPPIRVEREQASARTIPATLDPQHVGTTLDRVG